MYQKRRVYGIVLAAGSGSRMQASVKKQFMELAGEPLFLHSFRAFCQHPSVDRVLLVTGHEDIPYMAELLATHAADCREKLLDIVSGGKERYHSVWKGLQRIAAEENPAAESEDNVFDADESASPLVLIHDGARPLLTAELLTASIEAAAEYDAAVLGMPVKDTIKLLDEENFVSETPDRKRLWLMQTPQSFSFPLVYRAYEKLAEAENKGEKLPPITDDAMVVEFFGKARIKIIPGSYENIKVTTPEDLPMAELFLRKKCGTDTR